ncbi:MAG: hypothetical protein JXR78_09580, partial [Victivallales bacterium]|nr:hypothetical protein [Victivallales bacterium]
EKPFLYIISFDSQAQWATEGKTPVSIEEDFEYLLSTWMSDAWIRRDDRPVMLIFAYDKEYSFYDNASNGRFDIVWPSYISDSNHHAAYAWVNPDKIEPDGLWFDNDSSGSKYLNRFYKSCNDNKNLEYIIGGVWPGFNDTLVRWVWNDGIENHTARPRIICEETSSGNTLEQTWQEAVNYIKNQVAADGMLPMPIIQIVTWNDWAETTQVEPDCETGFKKLKICKKFKNNIQSINSKCIIKDKEVLV